MRNLQPAPARYGNGDRILWRRRRKLFADSELTNRVLATSKGDAATRPGKPRQTDESRGSERRSRVGRLEFEMPGNRLGKGGLGYAQHDRHCRIASAGTERDLKVQGVDVGQRDQTVGSSEIAKI